MHLDVPEVIDAGHAFIAAREFRPAGYVFRVTVRELGHHHQLLLCSTTQGCFLRQNLDAHNPWIGVFGWRHPGCDPSAHHLVFRGAHRKALSAAVRNRCCGLQQD